MEFEVPELEPFRPERSRRGTSSRDSPNPRGQYQQAVTPGTCSNGIWNSEEVSSSRSVPVPERSSSFGTSLFEVETAPCINPMTGIANAIALPCRLGRRGLLCSSHSIQNKKGIVLMFRLATT
ncbi:hypothetical protein J6590_098397 [Homalodisca vitripennis]|nr:hypothetical protein J6590_098397 [Homalodisca vitripennis]